MTSGTPESIQNWVLSGFQNCLDFASMSCLEAKAISSSATITSSASRRPVAPANHVPVRLNQISIERTDYCQAVPFHADELNRNTYSCSCNHSDPVAVGYG